MFFKHFASENQLPGLSLSGILVENGSMKFDCRNKDSQWNVLLQMYSSKLCVEDLIASEESPVDKHTDIFHLLTLV